MNAVGEVNLYFTIHIWQANSLGFAHASQQLIVQEIDLEIALRKRLLDTAQSRITWALLLQEALEKEVKGVPIVLRSCVLVADIYYPPSY